jgi:hypothetical protein
VARHCFAGFGWEMPSVRPRAVRGLIPRLRCRATQPPNQVLIPARLEISNLNPQRESEPAPGRMLICTPLSAVVSPPAANPPRGAANRTGRSAAERPRHACRRRPGAARRGSPVKYSVASRSPPCVGFTVGALHPARLEPTRGCRSQLQRNAVASDSESACASTTNVHRSKEDALSPSLRRANCAWFITRL